MSCLRAERPRILARLYRRAHVKVPPYYNNPTAAGKQSVAIFRWNGSMSFSAGLFWLLPTEVWFCVEAARYATVVRTNALRP